LVGGPRTGFLCPKFVDFGAEFGQPVFGGRGVAEEGVGRKPGCR